MLAAWGKSMCRQCCVWSECCWLKISKVGVSLQVLATRLAARLKTERGTAFVGVFSRLLWRGKSNAVDQSPIRTQFSVSSHAVRGAADGGTMNICVCTPDSNKGTSISCKGSGKEYLMPRASPVGHIKRHSSLVDRAFPQTAILGSVSDALTRMGRCGISGTDQMV